MCEHITLEVDCSRDSLFYTCRKSPAWHVCGNKSHRAAAWVEESRVEAAQEATRYLDYGFTLMQRYNLRADYSDRTLAGKKFEILIISK